MQHSINLIPQVAWYNPMLYSFLSPNQDDLNVLYNLNEL